ncbi:MAG: response regulator transcription factor [Solirubrobacterales bacterium]|nr:response regulator transcription factor [Solirubrobacterales bacterium]
MEACGSNIRGMEGPIRILVCDDVPEMRAILREMLGEEPDMSVVGEAGNGGTSVARAAELDPDVVLLDLSMPGADGLEVIPLLRESAPGAKIVVFSSLGAERLRGIAMSLGADRYVEKGAPLDTLVAAVREVTGRA